MTETPAQTTKKATKNQQKQQPKYLRGVKLDAHGLGVARVGAADLLVRRLGDVAGGVAADGARDADQLVEARLDAPFVGFLFGWWWCVFLACF